MNKLRRRTVLAMAWLLAAAAPAVHAEPTAAGSPPWRQLFNGEDLDGWLVKLSHHELGDNYRDTFRVEGGLIKVRYDRYDEGDFGGRFGHLFYDEPFENYRLAVEYRFVGEPLFRSAPDYARLNSGVMLHAQSPRKILKDQDWPISVELQFLAGLGDGEPRATGNVCTPGTHVWYEGQRDKRHILPSTGPTFAPSDWVRCEALVVGNHFTHFVNGEKALEYERPEIGGGVVAHYAPEEFVAGRPITSGYLALQAEGAEIDFRKVEIQVLPGD
ncbi:hypothetical protein Mal64_18360 [Pseudobythopirellula maris]|uniref:3-keto-alpha-glucoside-1,2-lyase/3-keto-2-hydroxy-glucal hydratase domain-containing protein n=1 Tax=Pseudobythopirellula maris TaxID=2527991 RepID=A0A5C5ZMN0_9BACT|nr:DUF1080 domain-containing protein [Pseudobythopirellula maris]TWT88356.1 hypothetical protein Mal64_18360 [Pseudobythopirellula maris]